MTSPVGEAQVEVDITLEPELLNSFCRRGRRRLRDIQTNCQVDVRLDKFRSVLHLSGSEACIHAAKRHIAGLGGPRVAVRPAVHAELLRTRLLRAGPEAAIARIQQESGCRVHVERSCQEVRLFGDSESIALAEKYLSDLDENCDTKVLPLNFPIADHTHLETLAQLCGVTMKCEGDKLVLMGIRNAVKKAVDNLDQYMNELENQSETSLPMAFTVGNQSSFGRSQESGVKGGKGMANACPTCGACPFCASCGQPIMFARQQEHAGMPFATCEGGHFNPNSRGNNSHFLGGNSGATMDTSAKLQPWMGQQTPPMTYDGSMAQVLTTQAPTHHSAVPGGMIQGMMPAAFMIPANMIQYGVSQGGQECKSMQTHARNGVQAYYIPHSMMPGVGA